MVECARPQVEILTASMPLHLTVLGHGSGVFLGHRRQRVVQHKRRHSMLRAVLVVSCK